MGVTTFTEQHASPIAPERLFKAVFTEAQNIIPNAVPQSIKKVDLEGKQGVGSISKTAFNEGSNNKYRIDAFDSKNLTVKYTLIDGATLDNNLESITYLVKFEPSANGGCVIKTTYEYHTKGDIKENVANAGALYKAVEDHLLKNPSVCA